MTTLRVGLPPLRRWRGWVTGLLWAGLAAEAMAGTLSGTARILERIALPPDAVFEAALLDISRAGAPARVLGEAQINPAGQTPFHFEIAYEDQAVQAGGRFAVRAVIRLKDRLLYTTDRVYPVLTRETTSLDMMLVRVSTSSPGAMHPTAAWIGLIESADRLGWSQPR